MPTQTALKVTSHVGRDLLQSAQLFRHEHAVVWEYVSNGLQYKDPTTKPTVVVQIETKAKTIKIIDNGRGMSMDDLQRYFQMHGENLDRQQGRPGRGFFGTGKSAAFGIATCLTITTVRNGRLSRVQLTKSEIEAKANGDEIPVKVLDHEIKTTLPNGTVVQIDNVLLKKIDIGGVIRHIERHIAHWPDASVLVNNHECEFSEPDVSREIKIGTKGTEYELLLGDTTLVVKVAKAPLDDEFRGIAILSSGVWHETTLAGCERKPFAEYLFGQLEVPTLASDTSGVSALDMSRSMKLNPRNEIVADMVRFLGVNLEAIRKELEKQDRERRQSDEQKRLQQQGSKIAELINNHFKEWSAKLKSTMSKTGVGRDIIPATERSASDDFGDIFGNELPAIVVGIDRGDELQEPNPEAPPTPHSPQVKLDENAPDKLAKKAPSAPKKTAAGGFNVAFEKIGLNEKRAKYDKDMRTIIINLEHPRIAMELKTTTGSVEVDDPHFLRMAYEIAFTEYAIVLAQELSTVQYFFDPQDALVELRQTIDDLSKSFASLWPQRAAGR
jgi:Histidine kinase-, DNA gyrase B-, and HSP90-like ATPase